MKHGSMAIPFDKLMEMIDHHSDDPWYTVIGYDDDELDAAEFERDRVSGRRGLEEEAAERLQEAEGCCIASLEGQWFVVTWPEHVTTPRYNSDATYHGPMTKAEAIEWADESWPD